MNSWRLVLRSLTHHWRVQFAVAMGVAAATAVLTGALLVGDSMRYSLRRLALERLGSIDHLVLAEHFFRPELADEIAAVPGFGDDFSAAVPVVLVHSTLQDPESGRRAGATILGVEENFWKLGDGPPNADTSGDFPPIVLNETLASDLQVKVGSEIILYVARATGVQADNALGRKDDFIESRRLSVSAVVPAEGLGRFSLRNSQETPRTAFVSPELLQDLVDQRGRVNVVLIAGKSDSPTDEAATDRLRQHFRPQLEDYGLKVDRVTVPEGDTPVLDYYQLTSEQMLLTQAQEEAALKAFENLSPQPALTYLANYIQTPDGKAKIPYSTVTAIDSNAELGPLLDAGGKPILLIEDEIAVSSWVEEDMTHQFATAKPIRGLQLGDWIELMFFKPESVHGEGVESIVPFKLKAIVPLAAPDAPPLKTNDPQLTPEVKGLTDQESIENWDPPFEYDDSRVRTRPPEDWDERYWENYRATPKAFVSLESGRKLWSSRFGVATSIRVPASKVASRKELMQRLEQAFDDPGQLGFSLQPIRRDSAQAAVGTTSFSGLFLGFSFFIIAAAVMLVALLFRLGIEQRSSEIGVMLAAGLSRKLVGRVLIGEGLLVAALGGMAGIALGVGYAWLMLTGLKTWWLDAIVTPFLELNVNPVSLAIGYVVSVLISLLSIAWTMRGTRSASIRQLMTGRGLDEPANSSQQKPRPAYIAWTLLVLAIALALVASQLAGEAAAGAFFGAGACILTACLMGVWNLLRRGQGPSGDGAHKATATGIGLTGLATRNAGRNPGRSTLTVGLVASASFLIVAISAFRLEPTSQGAGGFDIIAESDQPLFYDLNTPEGRERVGIQPSDWEPLEGSSVFALRAQAGDDASCTNLYQPSQPRVLGVTKNLVDFYSAPGAPSFAWAETAATKTKEESNPWLLLNKKLDSGAIPVVIDKNTAMYSMHLFVMQGVGTQFEIEDDFGNKLQMEIVGLLANSVCQGNLLISEKNFEKHFPNVSGYRYFLAQSTAGNSEQLLTLLEDKLSDQGFDGEPTQQRLESLLAVQNTYLSTFQSLGALGLLLGTFGLATVQVRSILERRGELALMRAAGFRRWRLAQMVLLENMFLLAGGLGTGIVSALLVVLPHWFTGGAAVPLDALSLMLAIVFFAGMLSGLAAVRSTLRAPILTALRGE